jgi:hypothetical protein
MNIREALITLAVIGVFILLCALMGWWKDKALTRILISATLGVITYSIFENKTKKG